MTGNSRRSPPNKALVVELDLVRPLWEVLGRLVRGTSGAGGGGHRNGARSRHGRFGHRGGVDGGVMRLPLAARFQPQVDQDRLTDCSVRRVLRLVGDAGRVGVACRLWGDDSLLELVKVGAHKGQGGCAIDVPRL